MTTPTPTSSPAQGAARAEAPGTRDPFPKRITLSCGAHFSRADPWPGRESDTRVYSGRLTLAQASGFAAADTPTARAEAPAGERLFRKKPVVIEAREWTGANAVDLLDWIGPYAAQEGQILVIHTLEGDHEASLGDMIVKGVKGEFYPVKPDIFAATYEAAALAPAPAAGGVGDLAEAASLLSCDDQHALASRIAANVGYDLASQADVDPEPGEPVQIAYTNWRGEPTTPTILPTRVFWGSNEWHPQPCWLLEALDVSKQAVRTFDLRKISPAAPTPRAAPEGAVTFTEAENTETYEIGERDGYERAVAEIDRLTGGDGEYVCRVGAPSERHCPNPEAMIARIVERFEAKADAPAAPGAGVDLGGLQRALNVLIDNVSKALNHYAPEDEWNGKPWKLAFESTHLDADGYVVAKEALEQLAQDRTRLDAAIAALGRDAAGRGGGAGDGIELTRMDWKPISSFDRDYTISGVPGLNLAWDDDTDMPVALVWCDTSGAPTDWADLPNGPISTPAGRGGRTDVPEELRKLSDAATPGPWRVDRYNVVATYHLGIHKQRTTVEVVRLQPFDLDSDKVGSEEDLYLIAQAVNDFRARIAAGDRDRGAEATSDDERPDDCLHRLIAEGKPHFKSGCGVCDNGHFGNSSTCPYEDRDRGADGREGE